MYTNGMGILAGLVNVHLAYKGNDPAQKEIVDNKNAFRKSFSSDESAIKRLLELAKSSDAQVSDEAIDALLNLSIHSSVRCGEGFDDGFGVLAKMAECALVQIYRDPDASLDNAKRYMEMASAKLFDMQCDGRLTVGGARKSNSRSDSISSINLPKSLLCIAYEDYRKSENNNRGLQVARASYYSYPGRFYEDSQIAAAINADRVSMVEVAENGFTKGFCSFDELSQIFSSKDNDFVSKISDLDGSGKAKFLFIQGSGHWVGLVGVPYIDKSGNENLSWIVVDTDVRKGKNGPSLGSKVSWLLGDHLPPSQSVTFLGGDLQEGVAPNCCGLYMLSLVEKINEFLVRGRTFRGEVEIIDEINDIVTGWSSLDQSQRNQLMAGLRAQVLLAQSNASVEDARPSGPAAPVSVSSPSLQPPAASAKASETDAEKSSPPQSNPARRKPIKPPPPVTEAQLAASRLQNVPLLSASPVLPNKLPSTTSQDTLWQRLVRWMSV